MKPGDKYTIEDLLYTIVEIGVTINVTIEFVRNSGPYHLYGPCRVIDELTEEQFNHLTIII